MSVSFKTVSRRPSLAKRRRKSASRSRPGKTSTIGHLPALSLRLIETATNGVEGILPLKPHADEGPRAGDARAASGPVSGFTGISPAPNSRLDVETGTRTESEGELADVFGDFGFGIHPGDLFARDRVAWPSKFLQDPRAQPPDTRVVRLPRHEPVQQLQRVVLVSDDLIPGRNGEERIDVPRIVEKATVSGLHDLPVSGRRDDLDVLTDCVLLL